MAERSARTFQFGRSNFPGLYKAYVTAGSAPSKASILLEIKALAKSYRLAGDARHLMVERWLSGELEQLEKGKRRTNPFGPPITPPKPRKGG